MKTLSRLPFIKTLTFLLLPHILIGQDDDQSSGGSESAAESSVAGSASKKSIGAPESAESSPAINVAKAGLSVSNILTISTDKLLAITQSGSTTELKSLVTSINSGDADLTVVADIAVSSKASGVKIKLSEIKDRAEIVEIYVKSGLSGDELAKKISELKNPTVKFIDSEARDESKVVTTSGSTSTLAFYNSLKASGLNSSQISTVVDAYKSVLPEKEDSLKTFTDKVVQTLKGTYGLLNLEGSRGKIDDFSDETEILKIEQIVKFHPDVLSEFAKVTDSDARFGLFYLFYELEAENSSTLVTEVNPEITQLAVLANLIFTDQTLGGSNLLSALEKVDLDYIADKSPPQRLLSYLAQYNVLGFNKEGQTLLSELPNNIFSQDFSNSDVTEFAKYLATYTTSTSVIGRDLGDNDLSEYKIPLSNIELYPGKNITLSGELDVSSVLPQAELSNNNVKPEDIRVAIIGAANDITINSDITIQNANKAEDNAIVIAAADDLVVKNGTKIKYEGSNLALASGDTMWLVNVDIEAGGNIAIGTLNDLHLTSGTTITAGGGGNTPNKDLVLLYANDYLNINNVVFSEGIREIHLEAQRVAMRNLILPNESFLKINVPGSRKWQNSYVTVEGTSLKFSGNASNVGDVVLENVTHPNIGTLSSSNLPEVTGI